MAMPLRSRRESLLPDTRHADVFEGLFAAGVPHPTSGSLLDIPAAARWFETLHWGCQTGLYNYQEPFEEHRGARVNMRGRSILSLSGYDYLGLAGHAAVKAAACSAVEAYGTGTTGVRMLTGTIPLHRELECAIATFKRVEASLTFSSGYLANLAAIGALVGQRDRVLIDELAHRSLRDACVLARVPFATFRHNDLTSLRNALADGQVRRTLIVVDGCYSMDGDVCPLPQLVQLKDEFGAFLLVDEAHAFGTLGQTGRGVDEHYGIAPSEVDIWTGSLSKAVPSNGGFVAGSLELVVFLQHAAAPYWFSAALSPASAGAALGAIRVLEREPERVVSLQENASRLRSGLVERGYDVGMSATPIVPVLTGGDEAAWQLARRLLDHGVFTSPVVHPAVPRGAARLRLCATAAMTAADLGEAFTAFETVREQPK
jgi:8-amino-7-oxononanoate synthase